MHKLRYERVYDEITSRIKHGIYQPGEKLPRIEDLAKEFNVGTSSIREAIRILNQQKILRVKQGSGTYVHEEISNEPEVYIDQLENITFSQLIEARLIIEPRLAELAAKRATKEEGKELLSIAKEMNKKSEEHKNFLPEDMKFHDYICKLSKNELLAQMMQLISDLLLDSRRKTMKWEGMDEIASAYHILIAHAIEDNEPEKAKELMEQHIKELYKRDNIS